MKQQLGLRLVMLVALAWASTAAAGKTPRAGADKAGSRATADKTPAPAGVEKAPPDARADKAPARAVVDKAASPAAADPAPSHGPAPVVILEPVEDEAPPMALREKQFFYGSFGLRDPFRSLVGGDFAPEEQELVDLHAVQLVGMLWEDEAYVAIVQDRQGYGYALRPGDPVRNGVVVSVTRQELVGRLNVFGMVDRVNLRLQRDEE